MMKRCMDAFWDIDKNDVGVMVKIIRNPYSVMVKSCIFALKYIVG